MASCKFQRSSSSCEQCGVCGAAQNTGRICQRSRAPVGLSAACCNPSFNLFSRKFILRSALRMAWQQPEEMGWGGRQLSARSPRCQAPASRTAWGLAGLPSLPRKSLWVGSTPSYSRSARAASCGTGTVFICMLPQCPAQSSLHLWRRQ